MQISNSSQGTLFSGIVLIALSFSLITIMGMWAFNQAPSILNLFSSVQHELYILGSGALHIQ